MPIIVKMQNIVLSPASVFVSHNVLWCSCFSLQSGPSLLSQPQGFDGWSCYMLLRGRVRAGWDTEKLLSCSVSSFINFSPHVNESPTEHVCLRGSFFLMEIQCYCGVLKGDEGEYPIQVVPKEAESTFSHFTKSAAKTLQVFCLVCWCLIKPIWNMLIYSNLIKSLISGLIIHVELQ